MEYRYRKACDIGDIITEDAMAYIAKNLSSRDVEKDAMQLVVYNSLPFERDAVVKVDLDVPRSMTVKSITLESDTDCNVEMQLVNKEKSSTFVDNIWDVPTILDTDRIEVYGYLKKLPALGYRAYGIKPQNKELRNITTMVTGINTMENEYIKVKVNANGTLYIVNKLTNMEYKELNYLMDQGECGNAWKHVAPQSDRIYNSLGVNASVSIIESGLLSSTILAEYNFQIPSDYADGKSRNNVLVQLPVKVFYTMEKNTPYIKVKILVNNVAKDHWLRVAMPTGIKVSHTVADSHFDVVERDIKLPDCTGWVEPVGGTHPLRTFVDMSDGENGLAIITKGIFEYEAFEDFNNTLALTLIRACRIKLAVSEEKQSELPDVGIQSPGKNEFEYAIYVHSNTWKEANLFKKSEEFFTSVRCAISGRGKGNLPLEASLFTLNSTTVNVTCVKQAEDGNGIIVRLFNPSEKKEKIELKFTNKIIDAKVCKMDESNVEQVKNEENKIVQIINSKKIVTMRVVM